MSDNLFCSLFIFKVRLLSQTQHFQWDTSVDERVSPPPHCLAKRLGESKGGVFSCFQFYLFLHIFLILSNKKTQAEACEKFFYNHLISFTSVLRTLAYFLALVKCRVTGLNTPLLSLRKPKVADLLFLSSKKYDVQLHSVFR